MVIGQPATANKQFIDNLDGSELTLKQLIELAKDIRGNQQLGLQKQHQLLERVSKKIWQHSVCEYDGY